MSLTGFIGKAGLGALSKIGSAFRRAGDNPQVYVNAPPPRAGGAPEDTVQQVLDKFGLKHVATNRGYGITTPYDYQTELISRQGQPTLIEVMSRPSDKKYLLDSNAQANRGRAVQGPTERVMELVGDRPLTNIDTMMWERGKGGSEAYQGLYGLLGPMDAYNASLGLSEVNALRRPSNMMAHVVRHPEAHNRVLFSADHPLFNPRVPGELPMDAETWTKLPPEDKIGWLALRERMFFDLFPDMGGRATSDRAGSGGLTQMLMNQILKGNTNLDQFVDDTVGAGLVDKAFYSRGGLVR